MVDTTERSPAAAVGAAGVTSAAAAYKSFGLVRADAAAFADPRSVAAGKLAVEQGFQNWHGINNDDSGEQVHFQARCDGAIHPGAAWHQNTLAMCSSSAASSCSGRARCATMLFGASAFRRRCVCVCVCVCVTVCVAVCVAVVVSLTLPGPRCQVSRGPPAIA